MFGGIPVDFNLARPCRVSKARFLQVVLYYLQMYILLDFPEVQELLSPDEVQEVLVMAEYCALHYVPWMLQAKFAASAPLNLLTAIERLHAYREDNYQVATIAIKKRENHLNFLSPELVVFFLFDKQVPSKEMQAIASQLFSCPGLWEPGERLYIYQLSFPGHNTFCTSDEF